MSVITRNEKTESRFRSGDAARSGRSACGRCLLDVGGRKQPGVTSFASSSRERLDEWEEAWYEDEGMIRAKRAVLAEKARALL